MRGISTPVTTIRRQVFAQIAKLAYENDEFSCIEEIPYKIIPGEIPTYRESVFKERAIVNERLRLAIGLPLRRVDEHSALSKGVSESAVPHKIFETPLVNVITFACDACPTKSYEVTDNCRGCLAHPCTSVCPVKAVSIADGKSVIDKEKCVKCGRCEESCPYNAITHFDRPCAAACGVDAIGSDHLGRASIDHDKCVSCGMCIVNCPFGAIADKSEIFQIIKAIKDGEKVCAAIAPSFAGQLGPLATTEKMKEAFKILGFDDVVEVALGADKGAVEEAHHYAHAVPDEQPFLATSCCPAWSVMAKQNFPDFKPYISESDTPMIETAKVIKQRNKDTKVVFVGPCVAKKLEATRKKVAGYVDFVITFEELMGMFVAKGVEFGDIDVESPLTDASSDGRGYAVAGGVADAITKNIKVLYPDKEIKVDRAEGLRECKKMLMLAKAGKRNGYLLEGMACPGGCIGGAGTLMPLNKATLAVKSYKEQSPYQ
ncbi:MAG: hypothetical protein K0R90_1057, partial [Oscillospiraceae bacterium]|nr:hypothetical protein [Oscillospiraceae bacterium]